jgi:hypothetical protein
MLSRRGDGKRSVVHAEENLTASLELELAARVVLVGELSLVKTSCVKTLDYSGYEHSHNYGLTAPTSQFLSSSIECVAR